MSSLDDIPLYTIEEQDVSKEAERLESAIEHAANDLKAMQECLSKEVGVQEASIFDSHLLFITDPEFQANICNRIKTERVNCEQAVKHEIEGFICKLSALKNSYMQERILDIQDIGIRLLRNLRNKMLYHPLGNLSPGTVIVAEELMPSDSLNMDRKNVAGIVSEMGGSTSHAAILARAMGIPCVVGLADITSLIQDGEPILIDGSTGRVTLNPSDWQSQQFFRKKKAYEDSLKYLSLQENKDCRLKGGTPITLRANINAEEDIGMVMQHNLIGAGLFRTELVFMGGEKMPGLGRQQEVYTAAAQETAPHPLTIRTFDYSADKHPEFLDKKHMASGLRGVALALTETRLFTTQLHAIMRAFSTCPNIRILLPMVANKTEVLRVKEILGELSEKEQLEIPPLGAMIETPIAVFSMQDFIPQIAFSSIGSNDLAQYMLGIERQFNTINLRDWILEPALLRTFEMLFKCAAEKNHPISVCGLAASDPVLAAVLVGLGARELSLDPIYSPQVRYALCHLSLSDAKRLAKKALNDGSRTEIVELFNEILSKNGQPDTLSFCG